MQVAYCRPRLSAQCWEHAKGTAKPSLLHFKAMVFWTSKWTADNRKIHNLETTLSLITSICKRKKIGCFHSAQDAKSMVWSNYLAWSASMVKHRLCVELSSYRSSRSCYRYDSDHRLSQRIKLRHQFILLTILLCKNQTVTNVCHWQWWCAWAGVAVMVGSWMQHPMWKKWVTTIFPQLQPSQQWAGRNCRNITWTHLFCRQENLATVQGNCCHLLAASIWKMAVSKAPRHYSINGCRIT